MLVRRPLLRVRAGRATCLWRRCAGGLRGGVVDGVGCWAQLPTGRASSADAATAVVQLALERFIAGSSLEQIVEISRGGVEQVGCHGELVLGTPRESQSSSVKCARGGTQFLRASFSCVTRYSAHDSAELFFDDPRPPALRAQRRLPARYQLIRSVGDSKRSVSAGPRFDATSNSYSRGRSPSLISQVRMSLFRWSNQTTVHLRCMCGRHGGKGTASRDGRIIRKLLSSVRGCARSLRRERGSAARGSGLAIRKSSEFFESLRRTREPANPRTRRTTRTAA